MKQIFLTGTMRTGGSLLINLLSIHSKVVIINERLHFFRFMYEKYNPINCKNLDLLLIDYYMRVKYRNNIIIDREGLYKKINDLGISYKTIYEVLINDLVKDQAKDIIGEYTALRWDNIKDLFKIIPNSKAIHVIRDPRAVLSSWKKLSSIPNNAYLNCIFNWLESARYIFENYNKLNENQYKFVIYENIMSNPEKEVKKLCDFLNINFENKMIEVDQWENTLKSNPLVKIPRSAHDGNNILGFSIKRTRNWANNLSEWEISGVEYICDQYMDFFGYEKISKKRKSDIEIFLNNLEKNRFLKKNIKHFEKTAKGNSSYPTDPTLETSWGAVGNPSGWFVESTEYKDYVVEKKKLIEEHMLRWK